MNISQRPVIVPTVTPGVGRGPGPGGRQGISILVPLQNVGRGPAINLEVSCEGDDFPTKIAESHPVLGAGADLRLGFLSSGGQEVHSFGVRVVYDDVGGQSYVTAAQWDTFGLDAAWADIQFIGPLQQRPAQTGATAVFQALRRASRTRRQRAEASPDGETP